MKRLFCSLLLCALFSLAAPCIAASWSSVGPQYKTIKAIAVSPQNSSIVYAGAFGWGVFKSSDGGATWVNLKTGLSNTYARSLLVLSDSLVYLGTNLGVASSTDGGNSWAQLLTTPFSVRSLAHDPTTGSLYAATFGSGLYKSTNAGLSWTQIAVTDPNTLQTVSHLWTIAVFGRDSLYVGGSILDIPAGNGGSLFSSVNGGSSWFQVQYPTAIRSSIHSIAISPTAPKTTFIIGTAAKGVYLSTNAGVTFTNIDGSGTTTHPLPDPVINSVAINGGKYYAGSDSLGGFYVRPIGDVSNGWTPATGLPGAPAQINAVAFDPGNSATLYVGTDGAGVFKSADGGSTLSPDRTAMMGVGALALQFAANGVLYLGTDFGDGLWKSPDSGATWIHIDSLSTVDPVASIGITSNPLVLYAGTTGGGVHKSTDGGLIWHVTDTTGTNHFVRPLLVDPSNPNIVYAGTSNGIYKTTNGGTSWFSLNAGIAPNVSVRSLDWVVASPATMLAGTDSNYLYRSTNGGNSWTNVTDANGFLTQDIHIRSITIDQSLPNIVYAGADSGRIYRSLNGGQSWSLLYSLVNGNSVRRIAIHPTNRSILFAATFGQGILVSTDTGHTWSRFNDGLADSVEYTLMIDNGTPLGLYAGSHAAGVFRAQYVFANHPPQLQPIGNKSIYPNHLLAFTVTATDPDGGSPSVSVGALPPGATFADNGNGTGSFAWTPSNAQIGSYPLTFHASDGALADSQSMTITVLDSASSVLMSVLVAPGWNMVSLPDAPADSRKTSVFPLAASSAFAYTTTYVRSDTMKFGTGYWLNFVSAESVDVGGLRELIDTLALSAGWNMIGALSSPVAVSAVQPIPPMTLVTSFFGYAGSYYIADTLRPGSSYWVRTSQAGSLVLASASNTLQTIAVQQKSPEPFPTGDVNSLDITDRFGRSAHLRFSSVVGSLDEAAAELPPVPPPDAYDVRFSTQRSAHLFTSTGAGRRGIITLHGARYPLVVRWHVVEPNAGYTLVAPSAPQGGGEWHLAGDGSLVLNSAATDQLVLNAGNPGRSRVPHSPVLQQNYPNPFNPSTTIGYTLFDVRHVELTVYDVLGRTIAVLDQGMRPAGVYSIPWNASGVPSGLYYYRLTTAASGASHSVDAPETRSLMILK